MTAAPQTETLIKETAKRVFFQKGLINATTQQIADEAGVNRALINYYFRSRDQLFKAVLKDAVDETRSKVDAIFNSDEPFKKKISRYLDVFIDRNAQFPYIQNFIITEIMQDPEKMKEHFSRKRNHLMKHIVPPLKEEIEKGHIAPIDPEHFIVNMMSMCSYPLVAKPFIQNMFSYDDKMYKKFLQERKRVIYKVLFNEELPAS
ncbi:MAG TPA: TetR/AcrR family transcriptional regulator [Cyclobacteriaceae bacterium]|nr:TetR/AcrR family transcriptional regulator [Cyclobacteriaceae bacterium]